MSTTTLAAEDDVRLLGQPAMPAGRQGISLQPDPPRRLGPRKIRLPDAARGMGIFCCATRGTGKSRMLGRVIAWHDFLREVPLVVLDPVGGTIDNLLDKIGRQPLDDKRKPSLTRRELWKRVIYVDMAGSNGCVIPWPVYSAACQGEGFSEQSQRFVDLIARVDPALRKAPILGFNALEPIAQAAGMVLCALGFGVTELPELIADPAAWEPRLEWVIEHYPDTAPAVAELRRLGQLPVKERQNRTAALTSKLSLVRFHPNFRAIFGAATPGINWPQVITRKQAVLIDFRNVQSAEHKKFALLWLYNSFLTFIKQRGHGKMHEPVSFIIDELTYLIGTAAVNDELLTADIDELVNRIARSHGIWLTLATQELFQLPEQIRQTVLSMGTVIFGQTSDAAAAEALAERYFRYDPHWIKKTETRFATIRKPNWGGPGFTPEVVPAGERTTEYTRGDQTYLNSRVFLDLAPFHFLIGQSSREGELPTSLRPFTTERVDAGEYPDRDTTDMLRTLLMRRDGTSQKQILAEIAHRLTPPEQASPPASVTSGQSCEPFDEAELLKQQPQAPVAGAASPSRLRPIRSRSRKPPPGSAR